MRPRPIYKGDIYLVTRRTSRRTFFLKPSKRTNQVVEYLVAVYAKRHGIRVHTLCVLGNHYHLVASDPKARIPDFFRDFHSGVGRVLNTQLERRDHFWDNRQTHLTRPQEDDDVLDKIVYTLSNPVNHRLVAHANSWPGLRVCWSLEHLRHTSDSPDVYERRPVPRPSYYSATGRMPATAQLELYRPPIKKELSADALAELIRDQTLAREARLRETARVQNKSFLGRRAVLRQSPFDEPATPYAPRDRIPEVAAKNRAVRDAARAHLRAFRSHYRDVLPEWQAGDPTAVFPAGTFEHRVRHGANADPDPADT